MRMNPPAPTPEHELRAAVRALHDPVNCLPIKLTAPLADLLAEAADRWRDEMLRDRGEGPCCDGTIPCCRHEEMTFHDGSAERGGCEEPYEGDDANGRCSCFDKPIAVARAIIGGVCQ